MFLYVNGYFTKINLYPKVGYFRNDKYDTVYLNYPQSNIISRLQRPKMSGKYSFSNFRNDVWSKDYQVFLANNIIMKKKAKKKYNNIFNQNRRHYGIDMYGILPPSNIEYLQKTYWNKIIKFVNFMVASVVSCLRVESDVLHSVRISADDECTELPFNSIGLPYCSE